MTAILPALIHYTSLKLENSSLHCVIFSRSRCGAVRGQIVPAAVYVSTMPSLDPLAAESRRPCGSAR